MSTGDSAQPPRRRRTTGRVTRKGEERPYQDPTPDDEPEPVDEGQHDAWLRRQRPPHHG